MTNLLLVALSLTLAAEPSAPSSTGSGESPSNDVSAANPPGTGPAAEKAGEQVPPSLPDSATTETTPRPSEAQPAQAAPAAAPLPAKPPEDEIEVLAEVVDLDTPADPTAAWYGRSFPERIRILALPTGRTVRKGGFELVIDHRASSPIYNKDSPRPFADMGNNLLGLDSALTVGLGLRYGILDRLDAGLYRVNGSKFDTYELDARFGALRQEHQGIDLMLRAGLSWFVVPNQADALWPFAQVFASRLFWNRLLVTAGLTYHANSSAGTTAGNKYRDQEHKWSMAAAAGAELRLGAKVALAAEVVPCVAGYCAKNPAFSGGVKFLTSRHSFALVCGNTQYLTADGYITNTDTPWSKLVIGFNITREY